jgi:hypothetical protein
MAEVWSAAWEYVGGDISAIRGERRSASVAVGTGGGGAADAVGVVGGLGVWVAVGPCVGITGGQCVFGAVLIRVFLR